MESVKLYPGDICLTSNPQLLGDAICFLQGIEDGEPAKFSHSFILADGNNSTSFIFKGDIYESTWTVRKSKFSNYFGKEVRILRHKQMCFKAYQKGIKEVKDNIGMIYPFHRLFIQSFDIMIAWISRTILRRKKSLFRISKMLFLDWPVCSELCAQFILAAGLKTGLSKDGWKGINPDDFDDAGDNSKMWEEVYKGVLEEKGWEG